MKLCFGSCALVAFSCCADGVTLFGGGCGEIEELRNLKCGRCVGNEIENIL